MPPQQGEKLRFLFVLFFLFHANNWITTQAARLKPQQYNGTVWRSLKSFPVRSEDTYGQLISCK